jgi:monoamine oxidase
MTKKSVVRPNLGGSLRPRAETPRRHFLYLDVTKEEQKKIHEYCKQKTISVSQFLADIVIKDAKSKPKRKDKITIRAEFEVTPEEQEKLELLIRLHQKDSIGQFVSELLRPNLQVQKVHAPAETTPLRYYLSEEEHEIVTKHMASKGIATRNYGALLALKAIDKIRKKGK